MHYPLGMYTKKKKTEKGNLEEEQLELLEAEAGTVKHFFGGWDKILGEVSDPREENLLTYPLPSLLFAGTLMYLLRLGSRRQINFDLRSNENVEEKFLSLWGVDEVPHGDTLNYAFKNIDVDEIQEVLCQLVLFCLRWKWNFGIPVIVHKKDTKIMSKKRKHYSPEEKVHLLKECLVSDKTLEFVANS